MSDIQMIGIIERGDPAFDKAWVPWVEAGKPKVLTSPKRCPHGCLVCYWK